MKMENQKKKNSVQFDYLHSVITVSKHLTKHQRKVESRWFDFCHWIHNVGSHRITVCVFVQLAFAFLHECMNENNVIVAQRERWKQHIEVIINSFVQTHTCDKHIVLPLACALNISVTNRVKRNKYAATVKTLPANRMQANWFYD